MSNIVLNAQVDEALEMANTLASRGTDNASTGLGAVIVHCAEAICFALAEVQAAIVASKS